MTQADKEKKCACEEPWTKGVIHRTDGRPCYLEPSPTYHVGGAVEVASDLTFGEAEVGEHSSRVWDEVLRMAKNYKKESGLGNFWIEQAEKYPISTERQRAYEEGKHSVLGAIPHHQIFLDGVRKAYEEGKQAMYESIYSRDVQEELRQEGRREEREAIARQIEKLPALEIHDNVLDIDALIHKATVLALLKSKDTSEHEYKTTYEKDVT